MKSGKLLKGFVLFLLLIFLAGCSIRLPRASDKSLSPVSAAMGVAQVSVYLTPIGDCPGNASFTIDSFEVYDGEAWFRLNLEPAFVEYQQVRNQQMLLGLAHLPPGEYRKVRLHLTGIEQGESAAKEGVTLVLPISRDFNLSRNDSKCLFLNWHLDDCSVVSTHPLPHFSIHGQSPSASGETLYVVCDDINTLYFVRTDTNFVVASMGFPGQLGEVQFDEVRQYLYLLSPSSRALYVIDGVLKQVIDRIPLPALIQPQYMTLSGDGNFAYVTDSFTDQVVKVDLLRRSVAASAALVVSPERIISFEFSGRKQLAVSSKISQQVFIINPENMAVIATLAVDIRPGGLLFNNDLLYVCDLGSNAVIIFNLRENRVVRRIIVGSSPLSITDNNLGRIFVGHQSENSLSVIAPGQFAVQRRLKVGHGSFDMVYFNARQMLYAAHRNARRISVIDLSEEKKNQEVPLGGKPFSIEVQN